MKFSEFVRLLAITVLSLVLQFPLLGLAEGTRIEFSSLDNDHPHKVSGVLYLPRGAKSPDPAVVMVHGTAGIDSRGALYRGPLVDAGMAVFEVDFKTGVYSGPLDRPPADALLAMGFAALRELRKLPAIDPNRIGILGFSMGGHLSVNAAIENNRRAWMGDEKGFAAHVAFYPVCKPFLRQSGLKMTGAPMIVFYGTADSYGDGEAVPQFKELLKAASGFELTTVEYAGATHGFNRDGPPLSYRDPAAVGGKGYMSWNADATKDSLTRSVAFLRESLVAK